MPNELPLPEDLMHLIEKREGDERRKVKEGDPEPGQSPSSREAQINGERRTNPRRQDDPPSP